jgi:hypothetical protein
MVRGRLRNFVNMAFALRVESPMLVRVAVIAGACVLGAIAATAEELGPEQARAFVVGKLFSYTCFDGTQGMGRIFADGSVVGTIRPGGRGEVRFANLPPGTLRVEGSSMCAHLSGMIMQPCFRVEKIDYRRFRGSISGLGFAYCDFYQHNARADMISRGPEPRTRFTSRTAPPAAGQAPRTAPAQAAPAQSSPAQSSPAQSAPVVSVQSSPMAPPPQEQPRPQQQPAAAPEAAKPAATESPQPAPTATLRPAIAD